jgi:hypothetical protein
MAFGGPTFHISNIKKDENETVSEFNTGFSKIYQ